MATTRRRCGRCRQYRPVGEMRVTGLSAFCVGCSPKAPKQKAKPASPMVKLRPEVLARDDWTCRLCGRRATSPEAPDFETHHTVYRSGGGPDVPSNIITLCGFPHQHNCHDKVHANKKRWQPQLLAALELGERFGTHLPVEEAACWVGLARALGWW